MDLFSFFDNGLDPNPIDISKESYYDPIYTYQSKYPELYPFLLDIVICRSIDDKNIGIYIRRNHKKRKFVCSIDLTKQVISFSVNKKHLVPSKPISLPSMKTIQDALYPLLQQIIITKPLDSKAGQYQLKEVKKYLKLD